MKNETPRMPAPLAAVSAAVFRDPAEVLLMKRARPPNAGLWTLPGGRVTFGETLEAAVRREVREETGLALGAVRVCDAIDVIGPGDAPAWHFVIVIFAAARAEGTLSPCAEHSDARWFTLDCLRERERRGELAATPGLLRAVEHAAFALREMGP